MHLLIKMGWRMDEDLMVGIIMKGIHIILEMVGELIFQAHKEVHRFARAAISTRASITPLRVQNVEVVQIEFCKFGKRQRSSFSKESEHIFSKCCA